MTMTDPIADMLTRIRNAGMRRIEEVDLPSSRIRVEIARILREEGFLKGFKSTKEEGLDVLRLFLKYTEEERPVISGLTRVSKPGRRVYAGTKEIPPVKRGLGIAIVSTSSGIMTDKEARKNNIGGEVICYVW
ncbi:MAG: 30S ribosomal protein S8 [Nitrospirae bacterium]|nr:30S ribosomal protein S8 [Nitrospirota bacterium]